jgi:hypothetical protein
MAKTFVSWIEAPNGIVVGYTLLNNKGQVVPKKLAKASRFHCRRVKDVDPLVLQANEGESAGFFPAYVGSAGQNDPALIKGDPIPVLPTDGDKPVNFDAEIAAAETDFPLATKAAADAVKPV